MQNRLPAMVLCWLNTVVCVAVTENSLSAQVITRASRTSLIKPLQVESWPAWLSIAWRRVSPPQSGELQQATTIRKGIVELLVEAGQIEQAFAAAATLQGLERYQAFAFLADHSEGKEHESAVAEAQRGFQFLSARNQEVLVADFMPITTPKGKEAFREMLNRCIEKDERLLALGRAAASAASKDSEIFEECLAELSFDTSGLNPLHRRYTAVALHVVAEGLRTADSKGSGQWLEICKSAAELLEKNPLNPVEVLANLASTCFAGGKEKEGQEMLQRALEHWRRLGIGTDERMQGMLAITQAALKAKEPRLPSNWGAQSQEEAGKGKGDWRWELLVKAGRISHLTGDIKSAVITWHEAAKTANSNPNPLVKLTCQALIALEAHEAGLTPSEDMLRELALFDEVGSNKEGTSAP